MFSTEDCISHLLGAAGAGEERCLRHGWTVQCHWISLISIFAINRGHSLSKKGTLLRATLSLPPAPLAPAFLFFPGTQEALLPAGKVHPGHPVCYLLALEASAHLASPWQDPVRWAKPEFRGMMVVLLATGGFCFLDAIPTINTGFKVTPNFSPRLSQ